MDAARWQRIERVIDQILDASDDDPVRIEAPHVADLLDRNCSGDPALRAHVIAFLEAGARADFLDSDAISFAGPELTGLLRPDVPADTGDRIGPWRLEREIGRGGSSVVYLARRDDAQFEQHVAIKLLAPFGGTPDRVRRFDAERRILASLDHPGIARIIDGGVTDRGVPYLVMEYVDGQRLTRYCEQHHLEVHERAALFEDVCDAVQFAHQHLVIHRDIKPSNILVGADGRPRLLDFGIAKLLAENGDVDTLETRTGLRLMTPEYAAPEQVRGEPVSTATDVYALGVVLFEMLAGARPYDVSGRRLSEIETIVCSQEPARPSSVASGPAADALRGDLDTIVLKALRKEPLQRYPTAASLAEDLRRHRVGLPVAARPQTLAYRTRKFIRRHRLGVAVSAAAALLVGTGTALLAVQRGATARQRDRATQEAAKAQEVTRFVTALFDASDPREALGDTITALDLLTRGVARADDLGDEPAVQAAVLAVIGRAYRSLGRFDQARPLAERALAIRDSVAGSAGDTDLAESLEDLGRIAFDQGDFDVATQHLRRAVAIRSADSADAPVALAGTLQALGQVFIATAEFEAADSLLHASLALRRETQGAEHTDIAGAISELAELDVERGDLVAAESLHVAALEMRRRLLPPNHPDVAASITNVAYVQRRLGRYAEAEANYRQAIAIAQRIFPDDHPEVARKIGNLGVVLGIQGKLDEADSVLSAEVAMWRRIHGEVHPDVATALNNLGRVAELRGELDRAEQLSRQVLEQRRSLFGPSHPIVAASIDNLALVLTKRGKLAEAEQMHREAVAIERAVFGVDNPETAISRANLAFVLYRQGKLDEAEVEARAVLDLRRNAYGPDHPDVASSLRTLGLILRDEGELDEAEPLFRESLRIREATLPGDHPRIAEVLDMLGVLLTRRGSFEQADSALRRALQIRETALGPDHPDAVDTREHLDDIKRARRSQSGQDAQYPQNAPLSVPSGARSVPRMTAFMTARGLTISLPILKLPEI